MKKGIIISTAIIIMIAVTCITAFAFWDSPETETNFDAANAIGQGVEFTVSKGDSAEKGTLIPSGALKYGDEKSELMIGSAILQYTAPGADNDVLKRKVNTFTPTVKSFKLNDEDITSSWSNVFELSISTSETNSSTNKLVMGNADSSDAYVSLTNIKAYAFIKFAKTAADLNSSDYNEMKIEINITFTIA